MQSRIHYFEIVFVVEHIEVADYILVVHVGATESNSLVEYGQSITHRSVRLAGNHMERLVVYVDALPCGYGTEVHHYVRHADPVEIVGLAARENGRDDFVLLCCAEDENRMRRRFLKGLQEGVERGLRKHVDLVYDVHAVLPDLRRYLNLVHQGLDVIHAVVGSGIQLVYAVGAAFGK